MSNSIIESHPEFCKASDDAKVLMVMEAYKAIGLEVSTIAKNLETLNTWIRSTPGLDMEKITECLHHYALSADLLTEQFTINSMRITDILEALTKAK